MSSNLMQPTRETLPSLIERDGQRLISAKTSAEVLEAKQFTDATGEAA